MLRRHSLNQLVAASVGCCGGCQLSLLGLQHGVDVLRRLASLVGVLGSSWGRGFAGTDDFGGAFKYPMDGLDSTGRPAGFLIANDGSLPQRLIVTSVCIKTEYLYSLPGQEMYPIDCPHILSFTWLACDGSRLCTDQQEWCELLVDIEANDLKEYLQFTNC